MRHRRASGGCSIAAALALACFAARAEAQVAVDWEVSGSASLGLTDNVANTAEPAADAPEGTPEPQMDGFGVVSPAARVQFETKGATQTLSYGFGYNFYFSHSEANSFSNALGYGLRSAVSDTVELTLGLSGAQSTTSQFSLAGAASQNQVQTNPGSNDVLFTAGFGEGLSAQLSPTVSLGQALQASYAQTLHDAAEDQRTLTASESISINKDFVRDHLSFEQGNDGQYTPGTRINGDIVRSSLQLLHRGRIAWSHDLSDSWTTQLGAGVVVGYDARADTIEPQAQPTATASLAWRYGAGSATLSGSHDATPNVLARQVTLNDTGSLSGQVALPRGFDLGGSVGAQGSRTFLGADGFGPTAISLLGDLAFGWVPANAPLRIEARYQFNRQQPLHDADAATVPTIQRQAGLLTTTFAWPGAPQAGGAAPFVIVPPSSAGVDIVARQAPSSDRAKAEQEEVEKEEREKKGNPSGGD